jgi:aspartate/methionine/tyrosine aminotransferase
VRVTSGASEALFLLIWTAVQSGDNIIVEDPTYGNVVGVAQSLGAEVRRLPLHMEQGWKADLDELSGLVDGRTRLIYLTHAHNPTGALLQPEEMRTIARIADRVGALFVCDEVFRLIVPGGTPATSAIDVVENAVEIADMTKPWGLGGLRVGWLASRDQALLQKVSAARAYATMCSSAPGEFLAEVALRHAARLIAPRLAAADTNRQLLAQAIDASGNGRALRWQPPQGGYTAFVQLPFRAEAFCRYLAQEKRILLLPGHVYGEAYASFVRIGFGCSTEQFGEGLTVVMDALRDW